MIRRVINFLRIRYFMFALSVAVILVGVGGYVVLGGFNLGIDFTAGLTIQVKIQPTSGQATIGQVRDAVSSLPRVDLQRLGGATSNVY